MHSESSGPDKPPDPPVRPGDGKLVDTRANDPLPAIHDCPGMASGNSGDCVVPGPAAGARGGRWGPGWSGGPVSGSTDSCGAGNANARNPPTPTPSTPSVDLPPSSHSSELEESESSQSRPIRSDSSDDADSDSAVSDAGPGRPRVNSGAWLHARRLEPLADGHRRSVLQAAFTLVELKERGASNVLIDMMAQQSRLLLEEQDGPAKITGIKFPTSLHMAKAVLGTEDASTYEFGWCPTCAWRYPPDPGRGGKSRQELLKETCPRCGHPTYVVCSGNSAVLYCPCMHVMISCSWITGYGHAILPCTAIVNFDLLCFREHPCRRSWHFSHGSVLRPHPEYVGQCGGLCCVRSPRVGLHHGQRLAMVPRGRGVPSGCGSSTSVEF